MAIRIDPESSAPTRPRNRCVLSPNRYCALIERNYLQTTRTPEVTGKKPFTRTFALTTLDKMNIAAELQRPGEF